MIKNSSFREEIFQLIKDKWNSYHPTHKAIDVDYVIDGIKRRVTIKTEDNEYYLDSENEHFTINDLYNQMYELKP